MLVHTQCITLTHDNFQTEVLNAKIPVLVDCWASWCSSFQQINPVFNELLIERSGKIKIGRLDIAIAETLAARYGIRAVSTLLLFQNGYVQDRFIGSISKQTLVNKLNTLFLVNDTHRSLVSC